MLLEERIITTVQTHTRCIAMDAETKQGLWMTWRPQGIHLMVGEQGKGQMVHGKAVTKIMSHELALAILGALAQHHNEGVYNPERNREKIAYHLPLYNSEHKQLGNMRFSRDHVHPDGTCPELTVEIIPDDRKEDPRVITLAPGLCTTLRAGSKKTLRELGALPDEGVVNLALDCCHNDRDVDVAQKALEQRAQGELDIPTELKGRV